MINNNDENNEYIENMTKLTELSAQIWAESLKLMENKKDAPFVTDQAMKMITEIYTKAMEDPEKLYKEQLELYTNYAKIWGNVLGQYWGESEKPLYASDEKDKRFKDAAWRESAIFNFIKQSYLLTSDAMMKFVDGLDIKDRQTKGKYEFYAKQYIDAMSPSNFAFTNPEIIKATVDSKGENLVKGFKNLLEDLEEGKGSISTTNKKAFQIGGNIATTKGKVVYKNDLMELIQYLPVKPKAYSVPLLLVPAWINKYYILDLSENNSLVKWLLERGYTVFMISWVNPSKQQANTKFEDYMLKGPLEAIDAIGKATSSRDVTVMGYCLGGTLLACLMAYMKAKGDNRIKAATLLTTMVDFSYVGDMSSFIDSEQLSMLDRKMQHAGYLDGSEMSNIFSALRANDLIWSFVVNNYLLGKEPFPFDILYWNSDGTRLPAATHIFYLQKMYLENALAKPASISFAGVPLDVTKIDIPTYLLAAKDDHIAPWETAYKTTQLFKGLTKFVLSSSGHVAGVVNPPSKNKYAFWENDKLPASNEEWLEQAKQYQGSWWDNWDKWNKAYSGELIEAPKPTKALGDAPGSYVKAD